VGIDEIRGASLPAVGFAAIEEETAWIERRRTARKTSDATSLIRFIFETNWHPPFVVLNRRTAGSYLSLPGVLFAGAVISGVALVLVVSYLRSRPKPAQTRWLLNR